MVQAPPGVQSRGGRLAGRHRSTSASSGWSQRKAGVGPWAKGPDSANPTAYMCLMPRDPRGAADTFYAGKQAIASAGSCALVVRTLCRFGPTADGPGCEFKIIGTVDNGISWHEVRDYAGQDFSGYETLEVGSWTSGRTRAEFAWVSNTRDSVALRYWCIDDVQVLRQIIYASDLAVTQFTFPPEGMVLAPYDTTPPMVVIRNKGCSIDTVSLVMRVDGREYESKLPVCPPLGGAIYVPLRHLFAARPWATPGRHVLEIEAPYEGFEHTPEDNVLRVPILVVGEEWQPLPDRGTGLPGVDGGRFAVAVSSSGHVLVRVTNPGLAPVFARYVLSHWSWETLKAPNPRGLRGLDGRWQRDGATMVGESLFLSLISGDGTILAYDTRKQSWSLVDRYAKMLAKQGARVEAANGLCWDGGRRVYVLGLHRIYWYELAGGGCGVLDFPQGTGGEVRCAEGQDIAYAAGRLFVLFAGGEFASYAIADLRWSWHAPLPGPTVLR